MLALALPLAAVAVLLAATLASLRSAGGAAGPRFWLLLGAALTGSAAVVALRTATGWDSSLSTALWWSVAVCLALFLPLALLGPSARRLAPLLYGYLLLLALAALASAGLPGHVRMGGGNDAWLAAHIAMSLATYALATLAAVAGLAVFLRERALKRKEQGGLVARLPSIADGERLQFGLLGAAEAVLGAGLATGLALDWVGYGYLVALDHKTLLSVLAFLLIGLLLLLHARGGLRGRRAARLGLLAYLLLSLSYLGVKVVTDVLLVA
ncbi:MAG: cytochrome c biogenesis protein CcsA [Tistlia sp.]|uniref:cytochrome c biogenesis protein CcsA n=1 Tax=Tistlia sp. TaxID=3057121 RepID=UPI0034A4F187